MARQPTDTSGWPLPLGPMQTPAPGLVEEALRLIKKIESVAWNNNGSANKQRKLGDVITQILNFVMNVPTLPGNRSPTLTAHIEIAKFNTGEIQVKLSTYEKKPRFKQPFRELGTVLIDADTISSYIVMFADKYRKHYARETLCEMASSLQSTHPFIQMTFNHKIDRTPLNARHPAKMLTTAGLVPPSFNADYEPQVTEKVPLSPSITHSVSTLALTINLPLSTIASLAGRYLHEVVELPPASFEELPPHAQAAWLGIKIASAEEHGQILMGGDYRIIFKLEPARQIVWGEGALPHDHIATTAFEQAIVNLAQAGEVV